MQKLTIKEIIRHIQQQKTFEATASDGSFSIKVSKYVPFFCTAIHDGGNLRPELKAKIALDEYSRWYEEDPFTGQFIESLPITLVGHDSRYEYDLNRRPADCIYEEAWGKPVWKKPLTGKERSVSLAKHANFYKVVHALTAKIEEMFSACVVYDMHSYNHKRWDRPVPLFNLGTERVDHQKFRLAIDNWLENLHHISVTGIKTTVGENDVFSGRGYNVEYISTHFSSTLVLATEIKKEYCDELSGEEYPNIIRELEYQLKSAILKNTHFFANQHTTWKSSNSAFLLHQNNDPEILKVDRQIYRLVKGFELLAHVNPSNGLSEQKKFFKNNGRYSPKFKYAPILVNPYELKQKLSAIRTQDITDISIRFLYESVINSYFDKTDLLSSINTKKFLYNSLRYFGRPSKKDLQNANYILLLPDVPSEPKKVPYLPLDEVIETFRNTISDYGIKCKIETNSRVMSQVMVLNSKNTVLFRPDAKFTKSEMLALLEHEIGVHMVTTQNSNLQQLKVFNIGLPVNTLTQEGLAILSEYLSGNITLKRLKKLALRVVVADMMCSGADFVESFQYLTDQQRVAPEDAYNIVARIYRGGGFTKDYLYLSGFVKVLKMWNLGVDLSPLLIGKTSMEFYDTITEMMNREMISTPKFLTHSFQNPSVIKHDQIYSYILSGLK